MHSDLQKLQNRVKAGFILQMQWYVCNGKSILGALHAMEFTDIWVESEKEIYGRIKDFVI